MKLVFILLTIGILVISGCIQGEKQNSGQVYTEQLGDDTKTSTSTNGKEKTQSIPSNLLKLGEYRSGEVDLILNTDKATAIQFDLVHEGLDFKELVLVQGIDKESSSNKIGSKTKILIVGLNTDEFPRGKIGTLKLTGNGLLSLENVVVSDEKGIQIQDT